MGEMSDPMLRPLSIGEIFDRAITLLIHNWAPLSIVAAIGVVPAQLAAYLALTFQSTPWILFGKLLGLLFAVATMATAIIVAQVYHQEELDWRSAVLRGLARIPSMIGVALMLVLFAILPLLIVLGIPAGMGAFKFTNPLDYAVAPLSLIASGAIMLGATFAVSYAVVVMGIDDCGAMVALGRALALFERGAAGRTLLFALAQQVVVLGGAFLGGALLGFIDIGLHNALLANALEALVLFVATAIGNVAIAVFYFDTAVRREGSDMQVTLDAMA
jgi:hypothetical protein